MSTGPMCVSIPSGMMVCSILSSAPSSNGTSRSTLRRLRPTLMGTHSWRFGGSAERKIEPRYPPRMTRSPSSSPSAFVKLGWLSVSALPSLKGRIALRVAEDPVRGNVEEFGRRLGLRVESSSTVRPRSGALPLRLRARSSLCEALKFGSEGLESLKFESWKLSLIALSLLLTCSDTLSNRESSPRDEAMDLDRYRSSEPSEFDLRSLGGGRSCETRGVPLVTNVERLSLSSSPWGSGVVLTCCGELRLLRRPSFDSEVPSC